MTVAKIGGISLPIFTVIKCKLGSITCMITGNNHHTNTHTQRRPFGNMVTGNNHHHTNTHTQRRPFGNKTCLKSNSQFLSELSSEKASYRQHVLLYIAVENFFVQGLLRNDHITVVQCLKIGILGAVL